MIEAIKVLEGRQDCQTATELLRKEIVNMDLRNNTPRKSIYVPRNAVVWQPRTGTIRQFLAIFGFLALMTVLYGVVG